MQIKYVILIAIISLILSALTFGQQPDTVWTKTFGSPSTDYVYDGLKTADSNYLFTGYTKPAGSDLFRAYLATFDANGDSLWMYTYSHSGEYHTKSYGVTATSDGGYALTGAASPPTGDPKIFLAKTDSLGIVEWTGLYGDSEVSETPTSIIELSEGGYLICGNAWRSTTGYDIFIQRVSQDGVSLGMVWYDWWNADYPSYIIRSLAGNYLVVGTTNSTADLYDQAFIMEVNVNGDSLWAARYGTTGYDDTGEHVCATSDNCYVIAGVTQSYGAGAKDVWVVKTDSDGNMLWYQTYGHTYHDGGRFVMETADSSILVAGGLRNDSLVSFNAYAVKMTPDHEMIWQGDYGWQEGSEYFYVAMETDDGDFILGGTTTSLGEGGVDSYICRIHPLAVGIDDPISRPAEFQLGDHYPNPFNASTSAQLTLEKPANVAVGVYDILGRRVESIGYGRQTGVVELIWKADGLPSGVYFYKVSAGDHSQINRLVLLK